MPHISGLPKRFEQRDATWQFQPAIPPSGLR